LKWLGLLIAAGILSIMLIRLALFVKNIFIPAPPPKPTVSFGKLLPPNFPQSVISKQFNYSINTLTGQLPSTPTLAKVYRVQAIQPDLLALSKFDSQVTNIGFKPGYSAISDKVFEWKSNTNLSNLDRRLRFNIVNYSFTIVSNYTTDEAILTAKNLPSQQDAKNIAQTMLENMQVLSNDIDLTKTKTSLYSIQNGSLVPATSISNAQIIEVDFFQKGIDKLPVYYENPNSSNIKVLIGGEDSQPQIVAAQYIYQKISSNYSTYPIITSVKAFDNLKQGKAYIASYNGASSTVLINNVFLAYFIGSQPQDFIMPIYVFEGSDNFKAYVSAITDEWINM
jgi:hypothetical protein